jgi:5-oxopent-3-ene-1,2,5-tricarboxylate decarboxylase / 2-hydroxyhepta-2,4-diene-1,7-dioate isomerase
MKHARVMYQGRSMNAVEKDGALLLQSGEHVALDAVTWLPPLADIPRPRTILALGLNYADHAKELAFKAPDEPLVFVKGQSGLIGHRQHTIRPTGVQFMHYECELAVVIGRTAKQVRKADAYDFIAGYTVANDYAIRDYLENWYRPNLRVKGRPTCTPLGPWLVDAADIADPMQLALQTTVNGVVTQSGNTRDMIFDVPTLIEYFSSFMTLQPGDLILTGTPDGVVDCKVGDVVVTSIDLVGSLENTICAPRALLGSEPNFVQQLESPARASS